MFVCDISFSQLRNRDHDNPLRTRDKNVYTLLSWIEPAACINSFPLCCTDLIQGRLLLAFVVDLMRFLFKSNFYSRMASVQENTVYAPITSVSSPVTGHRLPCRTTKKLYITRWLLKRAHWKPRVTISNIDVILSIFKS